MRSASIWGVLCAVGVAGSMTAAFRSSAADPVPYPEGYRRWAHVKSAFTKLGQPDQGFHHIYANQKALEGYKTGKFPDGAVIAFDRLDGTTGDGTIREGARSRVDVMQKDSARYASTGGWGYERFRGESRAPSLGDPGRKACFTCHIQRQAQDFVFSSLRP
jgi:hypothetical protein